jgi:uncharacterized membrane protein YgcG
MPARIVKLGGHECVSTIDARRHTRTHVEGPTARVSRRAGRKRREFTLTQRWVFQRWCVIATLIFFIASLSPSLFAQETEDLEVAGDEEAPAWPRELEGERATVVIYQPQLEAYEGNTLEARAAVSVTEKGTTVPIFGAVWFEARLSTDMDTRMATLEGLEITAVKFPDAEQRDIDDLTAFLEAEIPQWHMEFSIDRLIAALGVIEQEAWGTGGLNNSPPEIIYVTEPAVLVLIDGDPILADLEGSDLKYVANSAFYILQVPDSKEYYLKGGPHWYTSKDVTGEWQVALKLPPSVQEIADAIAEEEKQQTEENPEVTLTDEEQAELEKAGIPEIIVRTKPAELISVSGEPEFASIEGTNLLYVENSENDIVMDIETQTYYVLIAGRWYASKAVPSSDWDYISQEELPDEFASIPAESDMGNVRSSVAGTQEAKEAVLENSIPQTAEVDRATATVEVTYDGDPIFEQCADGVAYAKNTDKSVLLIDGQYWCCDEAVWFVSNGPEGPWVVADYVPEEVQDLPADCPVYNVKYVYIYESTPEVVYVGYTPGYTYSYVYGGCVVYGSGYWYRPWYRHYYYPRPVTYGYGVHWNPYTGWGFSFGVSFGWLHIGWGRPCCWGGWWGPAGYRYGYRHGYHRGYRHGYHHGYHRGARAGFRAGYRAGSGRPTHYGNMYQTRHNGVKRTGQSRPSTRPSTQPSTRPATQPSTRPATQPSTRPATADRKTPQTSKQPNNVYTDRSGNVYRQQGNSWQKNDRSGWSSSQPSQRSQQNLNRDAQARSRGNQKSSSYQSNRSSSRSSSSRSSSSRSSGGGGRSGGGGGGRRK